MSVIERAARAWPRTCIALVVTGIGLLVIEMVKAIIEMSLP